MHLRNGFFICFRFSTPPLKAATEPLGMTRLYTVILTAFSLPLVAPPLPLLILAIASPRIGLAILTVARTTRAAALVLSSITFTSVFQVSIRSSSVSQGAKKAIWTLDRYRTMGAYRCPKYSGTLYSRLYAINILNHQCPDNEASPNSHLKSKCRWAVRTIYHIQEERIGIWLRNRQAELQKSSQRRTG